MTDRRPYKYDTPVTRSLGEFHRTGPRAAERRMDEFTNFDWDTVHLFGEGNSYRFIDDTIGTTVFGRDGRYSDNSGVLLIFTHQGQVVHAVAFAGGYITGGAHTYPREDAVLRAYSMDPGPYQLEFVDEGGPTP
ncbi:MAG: hypothetical protein ACRDYX_05480 [Egibacteraceae bacterium]